MVSSSLGSFIEEFYSKNSFSSSQYRHMKAKHLKLKAVCEICNKAYSDSMTLKDHKMREHGMEAPYQCGNCGKV